MFRCRAHAMVSTEHSWDLWPGVFSVPAMGKLVLMASLAPSSFLTQGWRVCRGWIVGQTPQCPQALCWEPSLFVPPCSVQQGGNQSRLAGVGGWFRCVSRTELCSVRMEKGSPSCKALAGALVTCDQHRAGCAASLV